MVGFYWSMGSGYTGLVIFISMFAEPVTFSFLFLHVPTLVLAAQYGPPREQGVTSAEEFRIKEHSLSGDIAAGLISSGRGNGTPNRYGYIPLRFSKFYWSDREDGTGLGLARVSPRYNANDDDGILYASVEAI